MRRTVYHTLILINNGPTYFQYHTIVRRGFGVTKLCNVQVKNECDALVMSGRPSRRV